MTHSLPCAFAHGRFTAIIAAVLSTGLIAHSAHAATTHLYASPTGSDTYDCSSEANACSLQHARDRVRTLNGNMSGDIVVNLAAGTYALTSTFQLNQLDSGSNGFSVIYQGPGISAAPAVLSGGKVVTGWTVHDSGKNIWKATLSSGVDFRQLYVNGNRAIRARWPNATNEGTGEPYLRAVSSVSNVNGTNVVKFVVRNTDFKTPSNLVNAEVVWLHHWQHLRAHVAGFTVNSPQTAQTTINFRSAEVTFPATTTNPYAAWPQDRAPFYLENAYNYLDAPGEWFLDPGSSPRVLYYIPRAGEDMSQAQVVAPQVQTLMELAGLSTQVLHHVQVRNLSFKYSNWNLPSHYGFDSYQGALSLTKAGVGVPGAVSLRYLDTVSFDNNLVAGTGAHGILLTKAVANYSITNNQLSDLSAGGIYDTSDYSNGGVISRNLVEKIGRAYTGAVGIVTSRVDNHTIEYNEIRLAPYTGISHGWFTDNDKNPAYRTGNRVQYNHIHHVMQVQDDGAGIYTLGASTNNTVQHNYVHDISVAALYNCAQSAQSCALSNGLYPPIGIYLDESSTGRRVNDNVLNSTFTSFKINNPHNLTLDNIISANWYNDNIGVTTDSFNTVSNNVYVSPGTAWPAAATTVMNAAGSGAGRH